MHQSYGPGVRSLNFCFQSMKFKVAECVRYHHCHDTLHEVLSMEGREDVITLACWLKIASHYFIKIYAANQFLGITNSQKTDVFLSAYFLREFRNATGLSGGASHGRWSFTLFCTALIKRLSCFSCSVSRINCIFYYPPSVEILVSVSEDTVLLKD